MRPPEYVFLEYDQGALDAAYDQQIYAPNVREVHARCAAASRAAIERLGEPERIQYGPTAVEHLDLFRTERRGAPMLLFVHGGAWKFNDHLRHALLAEMFVNAGAHCLLAQFSGVDQTGGDLLSIADQLRRAVAFVYANAETIGGDPGSLYVAGHSSGAHMTSSLLVTPWDDYGVPRDVIKGAMCISGMYELHPVSLSARRHYVTFDPQTLDDLSAMRHLDRITMPVVVAYGTQESPEFQRQNREFAAALAAQGTPVELLVAEGFNHFEMIESLANPYGLLGNAARELLDLA